MRTPHRTLSVVKTLVDEGKVRTTRSAREGAVAMGLGVEDMLSVVKQLTGANFHKSKATFGDHRIRTTRSAPHGRIR